MMERLKSGKRSLVTHGNKLFMKINLMVILVSTLVVYLSGCETVSTKYIGTDSLASRYDNDSEDVVARIAGIGEKTDVI